MLDRGQKVQIPRGSRNAHMRNFSVLQSILFCCVMVADQMLQ